ncbi:hypothetical protein PMLGA01_040015900 [Plasmodium malariae]|uniref:Uncharacterized protein n=1 Tax=Plasmodium malariae TaxID=5858 RepID=A0A1C3KAU6_PLAMA|nr:hypothetical protein PMLGA01_040015900 [Plasmodium malariae]
MLWAAILLKRRCIVNITGYGNYNNSKRRNEVYGLVKNCWGMLSISVITETLRSTCMDPLGYEHDFILSVVMFKINVPMIEYLANEQPDMYNLYLKSGQTAEEKKLQTEQVQYNLFQARTASIRLTNDTVVTRNIYIETNGITTNMIIGIIKDVQGSERSKQNN